MTVLIVEDDPMNFRVFSKILIKRGGLTVQGSEDVEEIIRLAKAGEIEVILMDVSLARSSYQGKSVDGIQITQILKARPRNGFFTHSLGDSPCNGGRSRILFTSKWGRWLYF